MFFLKKNLIVIGVVVVLLAWLGFCWQRLAVARYEVRVLTAELSKNRAASRGNLTDLDGYCQQLRSDDRSFDKFQTACADSDDRIGCVLDRLKQERQGDASPR